MWPREVRRQPGLLDPEASRAEPAARISCVADDTKKTARRYRIPLDRQCAKAPAWHPARGRRPGADGAAPCRPLCVQKRNKLALFPLWILENLKAPGFEDLHPVCGQ